MRRWRLKIINKEMSVEPIKNNNDAYKKWKTITDKMYSGELSAEKGTDSLIDLLAENGIKLRKNKHVLLGVDFFVYDKSEFEKKEDKPLGLGLVYRKPDIKGTKTQDIFIVAPNEKIERYYSEEKMIKKYPWMKGVHKKDLPL